MRHFHEAAGSDEFLDPAGWNRASFSAHPIDSIEPLSDEPNGYRAAAIHYLGLISAVDEFVTAAPDARVAVVAVAVVLGWPSARGLSISNIAEQLGCTPSTLTRSIARFREMAGLGGFPPAVFSPVPDRTATSRRRFKRRVERVPPRMPDR